MQSNESLGKVISFYILWPVSSGVEGYLLKTGLSGRAHVYLLSELSAHLFAGVSPSSNFRYNQSGSRIAAPPLPVEREMRQGPQIVKERNAE